MLHRLLLQLLNFHLPQAVPLAFWERTAEDGWRASSPRWCDISPSHSSAVHSSPSPAFQLCSVDAWSPILSVIPSSPSQSLNQFPEIPHPPSPPLSHTPPSPQFTHCLRRTDSSSRHYSLWRPAAPSRQLQLLTGAVLISALRWLWQHSRQRHGAASGQGQGGREEKARVACGRYVCGTALTSEESWIPVRGLSQHRTFTLPVAFDFQVT